MERRVRRGELVAGAVVLAAMGLALLWPTHIDKPVAGTLDHVLAALHAHGVPRWFDYDFVQFSANVLLFAPLGAFVASLFPRALWGAAGVVGAALSLIVEFCQTEFLPGRTGDFGDVLANTLGAVLGGAVVAVVLAVRATRAGLRRSRGTRRSSSAVRLRD